MDIKTAKKYLGKQFDKEDKFGNYEFAMHLGEILVKPTGFNDITKEVCREDYPIFYDRQGDAYMTFKYLEDNMKHLQ